MSAELAKLIIRGYEKPEELDQQGPPKAEFQAMFNPENFSISTEFQMESNMADGETGSEQKPKGIAPKEMTFNFVIDGTGASGENKRVRDEIDAFRRTVGFTQAGYEGKERRPFYLTVTWGDFVLRCILKKMEIKYTLFRNDGTPVRAVIVATLAEYKPPELQKKENPPLASSLTQLVTPNGSDNLDLLAHKTYGDSDKLVELAKQNGLNSLKSLTPGQRLELPPTDKLDPKKQASSLAGQPASTVQQGLGNLF